jgi:hypothetical protein
MYVSPAFLFFFLSKLLRQFFNITGYITLGSFVLGLKYCSFSKVSKVSEYNISGKFLLHCRIFVSHYIVRLVYLLLFCFTSTWPVLVPPEVVYYYLSTSLYTVHRLRWFAFLLQRPHRKVAGRAGTFTVTNHTFLELISMQNDKAYSYLLSPNIKS